MLTSTSHELVITDRTGRDRRSVPLSAVHEHLANGLDTEDIENLVAPTGPRPQPTRVMTRSGWVCID